CARQDSKNDSW
nr:immunoglobulin heavy chain junction region [Macaca mulatta]